MAEMAPLQNGMDRCSCRNLLIKKITIILLIAILHTCVMVWGLPVHVLLLASTALEAPGSIAAWG